LRSWREHEVDSLPADLPDDDEAFEQIIDECKGIPIWVTRELCDACAIAWDDFEKEWESFFV
jgi:hypothetical protein